MSSQTRVSYPGQRAWLGLLVSGLILLFVAAAVGLVVGTLATLAWLVIQRHEALPGQAASPLRSSLAAIPEEAWIMAGLCGVVFLAALIAARSPWIYRPALSPFLACAAVLAVWVGPSVWKMLRHLLGDDSRPSDATAFMIVLITGGIPLASAALGGSLGARWSGLEVEDHAPQDPPASRPVT